MKSIIKGLMVMLMGSAAYGGAFEGNGGDIVTCTNADGTKSSKLLDYYELENQEGKTLDLGESWMSYVEKVHYALDNLAVVSPHRSEEYRLDLEEFMDRAIFVDGEIPEMNDEGELNLPSNCVLQQVAIQFSGKNQPHKKYLIHKKGWEMMNVDSKAGLILHEIIFGEAANSDRSKDFGSVNVRNLNRWISSGEIVDASERDMIEYYLEHKFSTATYMGYNISLYKRMTAHGPVVKFHEGTDVLHSFDALLSKNEKVKIGPLDIECLASSCEIEMYNAEEGYLWLVDIIENSVRTKMRVGGQIMDGAMSVEFGPSSVPLFVGFARTERVKSYFLKTQDNNKIKCVTPIDPAHNNMRIYGFNFDEQGRVIRDDSIDSHQSYKVMPDSACD